MSEAPRDSSPPCRPHLVLNALGPDEARAALRRCCGAARWVEAMALRRPFSSAEDVYQAAAEIWSGLGREDFLEAFAHHPRIGANRTPAEGDTEAGKLRATEEWSRAEQARVAEAGDETLGALRAANEDYLRRFGYIFIVCATGKSAPAMLALLRGRLDHAPATELAIAAAEQAKITRLRLEKLAS